ncbi:PAS domain S-box protein [Lysobacter koreensis]|uniref:histidine kinase n=1 Tax=Lysobacter koreensis TaxID=266122 RepID=A0ABW2YN34_9GAMM
MFPQLFDSVPDALIVVDHDGRIVIANPQAERLFGYPPGGLAGLAVEALMPQAVRAHHRAHRAGYSASPRIRAMGDTGQALTGQRRDGQQFPVEIALSPIQSDDGIRFLASIRDVTATQRARQALVRARYDTLVARIGQLALEAADDGSVIELVPALLAEALGVESVAVALMRADRDGIEVRASFGLDEEWMESAQALGPSNLPFWQALASAGPRVLDDLAALPEQALPIRVPDEARTGVVVPLLDRDRPMGALIALSRQPRRFDHDALHLLQSVANLIAALVQRRRTEEQLAHSQRLDAIGQLTGGIAHDFNNLLTVMSGSLQLLEDEYPQGPEAAELIASVQRSVARGAELTAKLLTFARRQRLNPSAIDASRLLRDLELMLGRTLGDLVRIEVTCAPNLPCAYADAMLLDTALVNLALNARDAMPRGGDITLAASERWISAQETRPELAAGHYVVFSVSDTGLGMGAQTLARAVEPFYTTKEPGRGSGLGLSMVYGFVRQSGGYLHVDSQLGYGTRVELYLPVAETAAAAPTAAGTPVTPGEGETVLVVEDEPAVRQIAVAFLHSLGYRVHAFASAAEALQHLQRDDTTALLFSDVMLGNGMDGKELARAARRLQPKLAVLLTSGYDDPLGGGERGDRERFALLRKPYRREQLAAAVRRSLARCDGAD